METFCCVYTEGMWLLYSFLCFGLNGKVNLLCVCVCVCVWLLEVKRTRRQTLLIAEKLDNSYLVGHWGFTTNSLLAVHISDIRNARFDFKGMFILSNLATIKCVRLGWGSGGRKIVNAFNDPLDTVLKMYDYIASVIRLTTTQIMREKTRCRQFTVYIFRITARVLFYLPPHRQDTTYHDLCYTGYGALARSTGRIDLITHRTMSGRSVPLPGLFVSSVSFLEGCAWGQGWGSPAPRAVCLISVVLRGVCVVSRVGKSRSPGCLLSHQCRS